MKKVITIIFLVAVTILSFLGYKDYFKENPSDFKIDNPIETDPKEPVNPKGYDEVVCPYADSRLNRAHIFYFDNGKIVEEDTLTEREDYTEEDLQRVLKEQNFSSVEEYKKYIDQELKKQIAEDSTIIRANYELNEKEHYLKANVTRKLSHITTYWNITQSDYERVRTMTKSEFLNYSNVEHSGNCK